MITSILLATTILVSQPKTDYIGKEYAFLGLTDEEPKKEPARSGSMSVSGSNNIYWVDLNFNGDPTFKRETGNGYVIVAFDSPISFVTANIPASAKKVIKSIKTANTSNLKITIEFDPAYYAYVGDRGNTVAIEIREKQVKDAKKEDVKKEPLKKDEAKKDEAKKEASKKEEVKPKEKKPEPKKLEEKKEAKQPERSVEKKEVKKEKELEKELEKAREKEAEKELALKQKQEAERKKQEKLVEQELKKQAAKQKEADIPEEEIIQPADIPNLDLPEAEPATVEKLEPKISFQKTEDGEDLIFDFPEKTGGAIFERFGNLWIVFDTKLNPTFPKLGQSDFFASSAKVKSEAMIYKIPLKKAASFKVYNAENSWYISAGQAQETRNLRAQLAEDSWIINANSSKKALVIFDDFTDDNLFVIPVMESGFGNKYEQVTGDFIINKSYAGIVLRPMTTTSGNISFDGQSLVKIKRISKIAAPKQASDNINFQPIYPFQKWKSLSGAAYKKAEQDAASVGRIQHANFLFSQGLYTDANIRLKGFDQLTPNFMRAVGNYMMGRYNEAALGFDNIALPANYDPNELLMWKIASNQKLLEHNPAGASFPDAASFTFPKNLPNYPDNILPPLMFAMAEYFIDNSDLAKAEAALKYIANASPIQKSYITYLTGKIAAAQNKNARAYEAWQSVVNAGTDRESRAKATYEMIMADLNAKKISAEQAATKLDKLIIVWRGDAFEYKLLNQLAGMYSDQKKQLKALRLYKSALTKFGSFPNNAEIGNKMKALFTEALSTETDDKNQIFDDLTTYYEFKELLPIGEEGDKIILNLADKLARYDLFEESAKLLDNYRQTLTDAKKRAEFSTKVAVLYFMNRQPQKVIEILKSSDDGTIPAYLKEERIIVATRSLIELGELDAALITSGALDEAQKNQIKAEVYWRQSKWERLVETYKSIEAKSPDDIMKLAIANSVLGNKTNLKLMRGQYGDLMAKTTQAANFDFVTSTDNINYKDLAGSLKLDATSELIKKMREKVKLEGLKAVAK